jgi:tetratricopeptide (TPR) repeat protein
MVMFCLLHLGEYFTVKIKLPFISRKNETISAKFLFRNISLFHLIALAIAFFSGMGHNSLFVFLIILINCNKGFFSWGLQKFKSKISFSPYILKIILILSILFLVAIAGYFLKSYLSNMWGYLPEQEASITGRFILAAYSLSFYIVKFFAPFHLNPVHSYPVLTNGNFPVVYYLSFLLPIVVIVVLVMLRKRIAKDARFIIFAVLFFLSNIFLVMHIFPMMGHVVVANRYSYVAYLGLFLLVGYFVSRFWKKPNITLPLMVIFASAIMMGVYDYSLSGFWKNSSTFWKNAVSQNPKNYYAWCGLGDLYRLDGNFNEALDAYNISIELNPKLDLAINNRGILKIIRKDYMGALKDMDESIRLKLENFNASKNSMSDSIITSGAIANRGNAYLYLKNYSKAQQDYDKAISIYKKDPVYFANRSLTKIVFNDFTGAEKDIEACLKLDAANPVALYNKGIILLKSNDSVGAKAAFKQAMELSQGIVDFYKEIGMGKFVYDNKPTAENKQGDSVNTIVNGAVIKAQNNDFAGALADLDKAIAIDPKRAVIWKNRGNVKVSLKDYAGAMADFSKAIELDPNDADSYWNLGNSKFMLKDKSACADWQKAVELGNQNAQMMISKHCN